MRETPIEVRFGHIIVLLPCLLRLRREPGRGPNRSGLLLLPDDAADCSIAMATDRGPRRKWAVLCASFPRSHASCCLFRNPHHAESTQSFAVPRIATPAQYAAAARDARTGRGR